MDAKVNRRVGGSADKPYRAGVNLSRRDRWADLLDTMLPTSVSSRLPRVVQQLLRVGPRYGIARGLAVYGPAAHGDIDAAWAVLQPDELSQWLAARNEPHGNSRDALAAVERLLEEALDDEELGHMLGGQVALLLGQVLVADVDGARWTVWPNGHPVVRIGQTDLDVTDIADSYILRYGEPPTAVVDRYRFSGG